VDRTQLDMDFIVSATITIDNIIYDIPQTGKIFTLHKPISREVLDTAFIKLYAYDRQPIKFYRKLDIYKDVTNDDTIDDAIYNAKDDTIDAFTGSPVQTPLKKLKKPIALLDPIPEPGAGFWVPMPRKYYIYENMIDLIFIQAYPAIVFTLADSIDFYKFLITYDSLLPENIASGWHKMAEVKHIILSWFNDFNIILYNYENNLNDSDDSDYSPVIVLKY